MSSSGSYEQFSKAMKVLVIGSGGREHAICRTLAKGGREEVYCANGNAGIARDAHCVAIDPLDIDGLLRFAKETAIDLTFVGGESPLALGIVDRFESAGLRIAGPSAAAARLESSKAFAKDFMLRHSIPTAAYEAFDTPDLAVDTLASGKFGPSDQPVVIKADGLAAGKGVVVAEDKAAATEAIRDMGTRVGSAAAERLIVEECLTGPEVSLLMFADGEDFHLMPATRDHKRIGEGDTGPNTGGMGTITDASLLSDQDTATIVDTIVRPSLAGCIAEGFPFRGILFLGLMMTAGGPKLLEYNVRFGDPETQAILVRLKTDLATILEAMADGRLSEVNVEWKAGSSACVVLAAEGYPVKPRTGDTISGLENAQRLPDINIFHAGTSSLTDDEYFTAGGRVLGVTAAAGDLGAAINKAYEAVDQISFRGMQFRRDIGRTRG